MQILDERGEPRRRRGQRVVSILLLEDLAIVPLLAIVAVLGAFREGREQTASHWHRWSTRLAGAVAALVAAGYWLLNPLFRSLASAQAREVMTAAALLVVLGAALLMQLGGLSMAMGAFLAGVLLSGIEVSPSARDRHRALSRRPSRPLLSRRRHVARSYAHGAELAADPGAGRQPT